MSLQLVANDLTADVASTTDTSGNTIWTPALRTLYGPNSRGHFYKFLQFQNGSGNVTMIDGGIVGYDTSFDWVTNDVSDTSIYRVVGIGRAILTDLNGGWFQLTGPNASALLTDTNVVEGSVLIWDSTTDHRCVLYTAGTNDAAVFAVANTADVGTAQGVDTAILIGRGGH